MDIRRTFDHGLHLLKKGRYAEGWPLLGVRSKLSPRLIPPFPVAYPEWKGEPLEGRSIIVWLEQGFGDQIMLCRFATQLKERGAGKVTLATRPELRSLLTTVPGVDAVLAVPRGEVTHIVPRNYWTRYFSLPLHLGVTLENLSGAPYLRAPEGVEPPCPITGKVGLVWRSSVTGSLAARKSLPQKLADRILALGAMSLHPEDTGAKDFAETAAIIDRLELVVTVDTAVAHLAGAMGKPVWVLLPHKADWRWLEDRTDSPWYASATLWRQAKEGDWSGPVSGIVDRLSAGEIAA